MTSRTRVVSYVAHANRGPCVPPSIWMLRHPGTSVLQVRRRSHGPAMARGTSCFEAGGCGKGPPNDRPKTARYADLAMLFLVVFALDAIRSLHEQGRSLWLLLSRCRDRAFCHCPCGLFNLGAYER